MEKAKFRGPTQPKRKQIFSAYLVLPFFQVKQNQFSTARLPSQICSSKVWSPNSAKFTQVISSTSFLSSIESSIHCILHQYASWLLVVVVMAWCGTLLRWFGAESTSVTFFSPMSEFSLFLSVSVGKMHLYICVWYVCMSVWGVEIDAVYLWNCRLEFPIQYWELEIIVSSMAARKPGLIALFDVDGTLTAPRKVWMLSRQLHFDSYCIDSRIHGCVTMLNYRWYGVHVHLN